MSRIAILGFAFGAPSTILSNLYLCQEISNIIFQTEDSGKDKVEVVYSQNALIGLPSHLLQLHPGINLWYAPQSRNGHPSTLAIANWAMAAMPYHKIEKCYVVSAPPHKWRCARDVNLAQKKYPKAANIEIECWSRLEDSLRNNANWFTENSEQSHTRTALNWWIREWPLRRMPIFLYRFLTR